MPFYKTKILNREISLEYEKKDEKKIIDSINLINEKIDNKLQNPKYSNGKISDTILLSLLSIELQAELSERIDLQKSSEINDDNFLDTIENNKSKPRIPFGSLVELGLLKPGTSLFDAKKKVNAKIMADGSIKYKEAEGSIHKVAAKIMGTDSYNGWTYWHYDLNGSTVLIDSLRQKFISEKQI